MSLPITGTARPYLWMFEGSVVVDGVRYTFWYEFDERDGEVKYEFDDSRNSGAWVEPFDSPDADTRHEEFQRYCQAEIDMLRDIDDISITPEQGVNYLKAHGYSGKYEVMVKGYDDDWKHYTGLTPDDLEDNDLLRAGYEDWRLWLKG